MDEDVSETISERRVKLFRWREGAARTIASILTATGAVEAISESTSVQGLASVIVGIVLEREANDPSWLTTCATIPILAPTLLKLSKGGSKYALTSATDAFIIALKCACFYMVLRLLFMTRRLRQLGDLQRPKDVDN